jgi:acyl-CoA hydrolase
VLLSGNKSIEQPFLAGELLARMDRAASIAARGILAELYSICQSRGFNRAIPLGCVVTVEASSSGRSMEIYIDIW